ncbi:MAG: glycosyltransferase, partial [Vicinamibacterales bacterium]
VERHGQLAARGTTDATPARAVADAMREELAQARAEISNLRTAPPRSEQELTRERPPARSEYDERARAEIEALRAELQAAQARVDDLLASASWRTMAPLRAAYDLLHRVVARSTGDRSRPGEARQAPTLAPNQLPTDEPPVGTAHQEMSAPHSLLVIAPALPTPDRDSGSLRLSSMLTLLRRAGHGITMLSTSADRQAPYAEDIGAQGITVVCGEAAGLDHLARHGRAYRTVLLVRPETALAWLFPVRVHAPNARVIYDTVDLHWVRMSRAATLSGDVALLDRAEHYRRVERFAAKAADFTLTVTDVEREALVELDPTLSVEVLPNIHAIEPLPGKWEERSGLVFIGGFFHEPNVDAVRHFAADILPIVHRRLPGLTFTIVGSDMPDEITSLQSTTVKPIGFVGDPRPHFEMARMLVAPLRYGAGMKGKIGHAMSHGLPVVTTTIGAEGMGLVHGDTALIADTPEAFAEAVVRLYSERQLWERLAARGLAHVEAVFSERAALRRLEALFPAITAADLTR